MFCPNCGNQVKDGEMYCANCGAKVNGFDAEAFERKAQAAANEAGNELKNAFNDVRNAISGNQAPYAGERLSTNRSLLSYILLSIITCGIYSYYFIYKMAKDVNIACEGDGESTSGLLAFVLLSFLTCGIYAWYWEYKLGNRLADNAGRYGMTFQENGTTVLMWCLFGTLLCYIGSYFAMHILIKNTNKICHAYNQAHGL